MKTFEYSARKGYVKPKLEGGRELIHALKSGLYAKAKGVLKNYEINAYCCLGVKCDLDGLFKNGSIHYNATVLPLGHPWNGLHGGTLYFPPGFMVTVSSSTNLDTTSNLVSSIADLNDITEDFSMVINLLEAAWDCV